MAGKPETEPKEICLCKVLKSGSGFLIGFGGAVAACIAAEKIFFIFLEIYLNICIISDRSRLTDISFALFRNKRFMLDEMTLRNASKFAIFHIYKNSNLIFRATLLFSLMNALFYVDIDWDMH